uniref:Fumarylacetoacetase-like C-terminal domain-containing protein n=1 Tax=Moniliophthora roreri TaxID=221103 RepID=A0A0W0F3M5_MONRR
MTARNVQEQVKKRGLPWSTAKGFDTFTPIGYVAGTHVFIDNGSTHLSLSHARAYAHDLKLSLKVNGAVKQDGSTADMIARIPRLLEHISSIMTLEEGDLILTGTPAGVGPVNPGDKVECSLTTSAGQELSSLIFTAVARQGGYQFKAE